MNNMKLALADAFMIMGMDPEEYLNMSQKNLWLAFCANMNDFVGANINMKEDVKLLSKEHEEVIAVFLYENQKDEETRPLYERLLKIIKTKSFV